MHPCYVLPPALEKEALFNELASLFRGFRQSSGTDVFFFLDSFDWRLFRKGWVLLRTRNRYDLLDTRTGENLADLTLEEGLSPGFCRDFPDSGLTDLLRPVLETRALLPRGPFQRSFVWHDFFREEGKILVRGVWESIEAPGKNGAPLLFQHYRILPLKAHPKAAKKLARILASLECLPLEAPPHQVLLEAGENGPRHFALSHGLDLDPDTPASHAVHALLRTLFQSMRVHLPGIQNDTDPEFLHDFRVAVRRMRSLLGELRTALNEDLAVSLREGLRLMGQITGEVRDLDVWLLRESACRRLLPPDLAPGLDALFPELRTRRTKARETMLKAMAGFTFSSLLTELETLTASAPETLPPGPEGQRPIGDLAAEIILIQHRRVVRRGRRISPDSPDEAFHALRVDGKKLRYLLEFFAPLFPGKVIPRVLSRLKALQDNLGGFNDLSTQKAFLISSLRHLEKEEKPSQNLLAAAAAGGLLTRLAMEQERLRRDFFPLFEHFATDGKRLSLRKNGTKKNGS